MRSVLVYVTVVFFVTLWGWIIERSFNRRTLTWREWLPGLCVGFSLGVISVTLWPFR